MIEHKQCFKCGEDKPLSDFYAHSQMADGHLNKCKECAKNDTKSNYEDKRDQYREYDREREQRPERKMKKLEYQRNYRSRHVNRHKAHNAVNNARRDGRLVRPNKCEKCGTECTPHGHHWSYKPEHWLDVQWLCVDCHFEVHKKKAVA